MPPEAQIDIYRHAVVLTRRAGGAWRSYNVAPEGLAQALAGLPLASGLLPPDTLGWGLAHGEPYLVRYVPPQAVVLPVEVARSVTTYQIQTPPLVWAGRGLDYKLYALATQGRPTRADEPLYKAPFPNVYDHAGICWGSADRPQPATPAGLEAALATFFGSQFSLHVDNQKSKKYPATVVALWKELDAETPYPLDDLVAVSGATLGWLLAGGPWGGGA
jgi:PRTRC genetic system protein B